MPKFFTLLVLTAVLTCTACSTSPYMTDASNEKRPKWLDRTSYKLGPKRYYVGHTTGADSEEDARRLAREDAVRQLIQEIGVTVSEESKSVQREKDGQYSYEVQLQVTSKSKPVRLSNLKEEGEYFETWWRSGTKVDAWAMISLPQADFATARRALIGRVLLVWECASRPDGACATAHEEAVKAAATDAGRPLVPETARLPQQTLPVLGANHNAALVLSVKLDATFDSEHHGEFFAYATATAQVIDTGDGKVICSVDTGQVKAGHFSKKDAAKTALDEAVKQLAAELKTKLAQ